MALVDWTSVQRQLHQLGFDPGPIDGIRGRRTIGAVKRLQQSRGLVADGIVGPATVRALFGERGDGEPPGLDRMPWYGLFAGHCVGASLPDEVLPSVVLRARAWEAFGVPATPQLGAVLVFWRKSAQSGLGHVGFYFAEDESSYHVLGGNQSNMVNVARLHKHRLIAARWPVTALAPEEPLVVADAGGGAFSTDES